MITELIISLIYNVFMFVFGGHEPLRFNIDSSVYDFICDFMAFIFFIIPVEGLKVILSTIVTVIVFRSVISFIKTIWDLLPLL